MVLLLNLDDEIWVASSNRKKEIFDMKFGKNLLRVVELSDPEWGSVVVSNILNPIAKIDFEQAIFR